MAVETRKGSGLGRGLAALIPIASPSVSKGMDVLVATVQPNPEQPRRTFDEAELRALAASIRTHGVLQPIVVVESDGGYTLVAGERRLRAAKLVGLESIPAVIRTANELERLELALVENLQRADLNAIDEARAYRHLIDEFGLTQDRVAERVGKSRPTVANALRILDTAAGVQQAVVDGTISGGHARALAGLGDHAHQEVVLASVVARSLSVRQTESLVAATRGLAAPGASTRTRESDPDLGRLEAEMREALGTKVSVVAGRNGGRITIAWYDEEDLSRLVDRLTAQPTSGGTR